MNRQPDEFLTNYLNAYSPVAQEEEGQQVWRDFLNPYVDAIHTDAYGTSYGVVKGNGKSNLKVVIEAHCDEIAWIITQIQDDGLIRVKRHGGSDNMIAPAKSVLIHTHDGKKIPAVFGWPAIHTRKSAVVDAYDYHQLWVDTGLKDKEAVTEAGIEVGCLITFDTQLSMLGDYYVGRSLDNKIGGYIIAQVAKELKELGESLPYDLYIVNSVQEEVGLHGARLIAQRLQADLALVHDVCHETNSPGYNKAKEGDVKGGEGPTLEYTAQNHRKINASLRELAKDKGIPLQLAVGSYGNDTMSFFIENTPTAILATPLKYMHTTVEMAHADDVDNCIKLYIEYLRNLTVESINDINNR